MRIAGIVLDIYDDPKGLVLRRKIAASGQPLHEKLASATLLSADEQAQLPDRLFAMVATNGGDVVRKYAMHDEAHLATSMIYFSECGHLLPEPVQQKVASNLINGCSWYGMDPPEKLVKVAVGLLTAAVLGTGMMSMAGKAREGAEAGKHNMDRFREAQAVGTKTAGRHVELSLSEDQAMQKGEGPEAGHIFGLLDSFSDHKATHAKLDEQLRKIDQVEPGLGKKADLTGTEAMPAGGSISGVLTRRSPGHRLDLPSKTSAAKIAAQVVPEGWQHAGDITAEQAPATTKRASHQHYALPHLQQYPIDTTAMVTKAASYFDEHVYEFPLVERRVFSQCVVQRAEELGVKVAGALLSYAGDDYGPFIGSELHARVNRFEGTPHSAVYEMLLEKKAEINPMIMADMLREADQETGAAAAYGRPGVGFLDPYAAVYGGPSIKVAEDTGDNFSWSAGTDYVNGAQLSALSDKPKVLDEMFGEGFGKSFAADPVGIFKSMPDPQKVVLSRLAAHS